MKKVEDQSVLLSKYFIDNFGLELLSDEKKPVNEGEELAQKYFVKVLEVFTVFDRLCRYEKYFADFMPTVGSGISDPEAIEYHLRNYVQEFYILRERVHNIVNELKKDLPHYNIKNVKDVEDALNHLKKHVDENFKDINDNLRQTHVHEKSISDFDLTRGKFMAQLLSGEIPLPSNGSSEVMDKIKKLYERVVESSKIKYIDQAVKNCINLKKSKQFFAARFGYIFAEINGHNGDGFDMNAHSSKEV